MIRKKLSLIILLSQLLVPTYSIIAKVEFLISDKKMASVRKANKAIKKLYLGKDYVDLDDVKYNLNLMWINKELKEEQEGIHPENDTFVETILNWAQCNKRSVVNVWFDSALTSEKAVQTTQDMLDKRRFRQDMAKIVLKDIRTLPEVKDNSDVFSDPRMPVYFRADLARAIVLHNMVNDNSNEYSIYSDLDIKALPKYRLFDAETLKNLKKYGVVMAADDWHIFENGFQMMSNHQPNLIKAHKKAVIDVNIARACNAINGKADYKDDRESGITPFHVIAQQVYGSYRPMFKYFYTLEGQGRLIMNADNTDYDENKDGIDAFGLQRFCEKFTFEPKDQACMDKNRIMIPRKDVDYPPISGQYHLK